MHTLLHSSDFFFDVAATTVIYSLSLHDALPIFGHQIPVANPPRRAPGGRRRDGRRLRGVSQIGAADELLVGGQGGGGDRKSTRLNSSHRCISYAVFCLKKKKTKGQGVSHLHGLR